MVGAAVEVTAAGDEPELGFRGVCVDPVRRERVLRILLDAFDGVGDGRTVLAGDADEVSRRELLTGSAGGPSVGVSAGLLGSEALGGRPQAGSEFLLDDHPPASISPMGLAGGRPAAHGSRAPQDWSRQSREPTRSSSAGRSRGEAAGPQGSYVKESA